MISKDAQKLIESKPVAIATCTLDKPNVSVAAGVKVLEDKIIITDNYMSKTIKNLQLNKKIELAVWGDDEIGYKITGTAIYEVWGHWAKVVKELPENKTLPAKGAIVVTVTNIKRIGD